MWAQPSQVSFETRHDSLTTADSSYSAEIAATSSLASLSNQVKEATGSEGIWRRKTTKKLPRRLKFVYCAFLAFKANLENTKLLLMHAFYIT